MLAMLMSKGEFVDVIIGPGTKFHVCYYFRRITYINPVQFQTET